MSVPLYHAETSWLNIVYPQRSKCVSCVLCGGRISGPRKIITLKTLKSVISKIYQKLPNNKIAATYHGICTSVAKIQDKDSAIMYSCACCHHWFEMRMKRKLPSLPLLSLQWHINTLSVHGQKTLDARPIFRLSKILSNKKNNAYINFFSTLFTASEMDLFVEIASANRNEIQAKQCIYYNKICVDTLLVPNGRVAELLREHTESIECLEKYYTSSTCKENSST